MLFKVFSHVNLENREPGQEWIQSMSSWLARFDFGGVCLQVGLPL